jgi:hypothetical protein
MYSKTIAGNRKAPPPRQLYVAPELLQSIWEPLLVSRRQLMDNPWQKRVGDLQKSSAAHVKEGLIYESRAVVWNNPLRPVDISGWGQLNNITGLGAKPSDKEFITAFDAINTEIDSHLNKEVGALGIEKPTARQKAIHKAKITKYLTNHAEWKHPSLGLTKKGHDYVRILMKRGGYFVAPKLSTLELRNDMDIFKKGKGDNYIELDGLIHDVKANKFIILELKKGLGKKGEEEAQQMRKAAALLRKWSWEILKKVPIVELYFAAGEASAFEEYNYNSEKNAGVQNWSPSQIQRSIEKAPNHIAYIKTPVNLLLGFGLADFLRLNPDRVRNIVNRLSSVTRGWDASNDYLEKLRSSDDAIIPYLYTDKGLTQKPRFPKAPLGGKLFFDIKSFALANPDFLKTIPTQWLPVAKFQPTNILSRIAETTLYIKQREAKMNRPGINNATKASIKSNLVSHIKLLLSNKYKNIVKPTTRAKLENKLRLYGGVVQPVVNSPGRNTKYYSRVLKGRQMGKAKYFKLKPGGNSGSIKKKSVERIKFGSNKVRTGGIVAEYNFGRKPPRYNVGNFTINDVRAMTNEEVVRKMTVLGVRAIGVSTKENKNTALRFAQAVVNSGNKNQALVNAARKQIAEVRSNYGSILMKQAPARQAAAQAPKKAKGKSVARNASPGSNTANSPTYKARQGPRTAPKERAPPGPKTAARQTGGNASNNNKAAKKAIVEAAVRNLGPAGAKKLFPVGVASVAKFLRTKPANNGPRNLRGYAQSVSVPQSMSRYG